MPLPSLHPSLPQNPTAIGSSSYGHRSLGSAAVASSANAGGSVSRETLKGLQDVLWSDDEDDPDCLLCAEPLDLSDLNFKPCQCGLPICQFCYNKLLHDDPRCPGCRQRYDRTAVVFQPVDFEEVKKAKEKKTKRAKTIKQLTTMGRRHLLGTRVVMKNMVYVTGMPLPASTPEESVAILRTHEYFGQYGKITKIYTRERSSLSSSTVHTLSAEDPTTSHGIYIVFSRREDAARAIALINANTSVNGFSASYGTTRYCDAFLKSQKCDNPSCHNLHEWGGENDCFSKDDYETALTKPAEYDARQKQATVAPPSLTIKSHWPKPNQDDAGSSALPNSAGWGKNISVKTVPAKPVNNAKSLKIGNMVSLKSNSAFPLPSPSLLPIGSSRSEKKKSTAMSRGKSSDSTQSTNPPSSAQASPKKKPISLSSSTTTKPVPPPGIAPPPGLTPLDKPSSSNTSLPSAIPADVADEPMPEEAGSAESEAGPSSPSPAPQTPVQPANPPLPAPLTGEPIYLHSPFEEPEVFEFPTTTDPDFEFVLGLDVGEAQSSMLQFTPTPFSKTLVGLAELGVLPTDIPHVQTIATRPDRAFSSTFQPFDLSSSLSEDDGPMAGPSRTTRTPLSTSQRGEQEEELEPPRTTSRFDFARQSHTPHSHLSNSRGQSPFTLRTPGGGMGDWGMSRPPMQVPHQGHQHHQQQHQHQHHQHQPHQLFEEQLVAQRQQQQHTGDSRAGALAQQVASFVGSYGSSSAGVGVGSGAGQDWAPQQQSSEYVGSPIRLDGRMSQLSLGRPGPHGHSHPQGQGHHGRNGAGTGGGDGDYDQSISHSHSQYGAGGAAGGGGGGHQPQPQPQRLFSPESSIHEDQHYHPAQYNPLHQNFFQHQAQQGRTQSPVPMSINPHSFRRY